MGSLSLKVLEYHLSWHQVIQTTLNCFCTLLVFLFNCFLAMYGQENNLEVEQDPGP